MGIFLKDISLKGKTALITGATKGLGRGAAEAIAEAGGNIIAIGRNQSELNSLGKKIKKIGPLIFLRLLEIAYIFNQSLLCFHLLGEGIR